MTEQPWNAYERLDRYALPDDAREELLSTQLECALTWSTTTGWPIGVVHWFLWRDDRFWVTVGASRLRVAALRSRPQSSVIVSSAGALEGPPRSVTAKTLATVHDDGQHLRSWFAHQLAAKAHGAGTTTATRFEQMLLETPRVVIELEPVSWISYDAARLRAALGRQR